MIRLKQVSKVFKTSRGQVKALDDVSLSVRKNEFVVVRGPSGSGKTTLLFTLGGMLEPNTGQVIVCDRDVYSMSSRARAKFRAGTIGFVFQMFHLVPYLDVHENIVLTPRAGHQRRNIDTGELVDRLGLSSRIHHKPSELSAGEMQRTAIARAIFRQPEIILADEPTGNLDPGNTREIIDHLCEYHSSGGTVVMVTHGREAESHADRIIRLEEGRIDIA